MKTIVYQKNYEEITVGTITYSVHYVYSPDELVAMIVTYDSANASYEKVYGVVTNHQGSIMALYDTQGKIVWETSYDAWGRERNIAGADYSIPPARPVWLIRGYTGHEHLAEFGLINMNGRMYDPQIGRMLSPDNFVQDATSTQGYNRYTYVLNNPLKYKDPSGEVFVVDDIILAAFIGGMINVAIQGFSGNINSLGDFGMAFGIGALAGAGGAFVGGAVAGAIGFGGFAGGSVVGGAAGFTGGFVGSAGNAWFGGANFGEGLVAGLKGGVFGAVTGGLIGGTSAGIDAVGNGANFWNGKVTEVGGGGSGIFLDEEIPAGAKPTATGEIAKTSSNPNYGKYGMTRNGGTKAHYGVDYVGNEGDDVFAMYDGKVIKIGGSKAYGENFVRTSSIINGKTYNVDYGHMSKSVVTLDKTVIAGQKIGEMGRLGNLANTSFPTHVHIAVWRPVNGLQGFVMPWWK
ncbi:MAG: RHS repeat-associated core domain-containing protein [Bacteroidota bacterium]